MKIICILILIAIIILSFTFKAKIYSPIILLPISFLILYLLQIMRFYGLFKAGNNSFLICTIGVVSFVIGCVVELLFSYKDHIVKYEINTFNISSEINKYKKLLLFFMLLSLIVVFLYSRNSIGYLSTGGSLYDMRYSQQDALHTSGFLSFLFVYFGVPIIFIGMPISIYSLFIMKIKSLFILNMIAVFFWFIGMGARLPVVYVILGIVCVLLLFYPILVKQKRIKNILITIIVLIMVIDIISILRKNVKDISSDNVSFLQGLYYYLGGSLINMSDKLSYVSSQNPLYGIAFLYGLFSVLSNLINIPLVDHANYFFNMVQNDTVFISSQSNQQYNFGTTGFLNLFADGKLVGVIFIGFLFGLISQYIYKKFMLHNDLKYFILYSLMMESIMLFVLTDMLSTISFDLAIIYCCFCIKSNKLIRDYVK